MPAARSTRARPRQISFVPAPLRNAFPDYFALVMATGIVSIALADQGFSTAAWTLFIVNAIAYGLLWGCGFTRLAAGVREAVAGLADHRTGPAFLTIVAGTSVLGVQCIRLAQWPAAAGALTREPRACRWSAGETQQLSARQRRGSPPPDPSSLHSPFSPPAA